jgi:hypothetical protein
MVVFDIADSLRLNRIDQSARDGIALGVAVIEPDLPRILAKFNKQMSEAASVERRTGKCASTLLSLCRVNVTASDIVKVYVSPQ